MTRANCGYWILSDSEMLMYRIYTDLAINEFRKRGFKTNKKEAKKVAEKIDQQLNGMDYISFFMNNAVKQ